MSVKTIAIVYHAAVRPHRMQQYRVWHCAQAWQQRGYEVKLLRGIDQPVVADLIIPQIDLSVIPAQYRPLLQSETPVVNRRVLDIRKSVFSRNLVSPDDGYDGPIIVKTDANCGGGGERSVFRKAAWPQQLVAYAGQWSGMIRKIAAARSFSRLAHANALQPANYQVFESKRLLPRGVFANIDLVVEKFLPEVVDGYYYIRSYAFFGNGHLTVRCRSKLPVVKGVSSENDLEIVPVDDAIVAARHRLGFDYGKFDYVVHDGQAVLLDVNATPTFGSAYTPEVRAQVTARLVDGIGQWFR